MTRAKDTESRKLTRPAGRTSRILGQPDRPHRGREAVDDVELARRIVAEARHHADDLHRRETAHQPDHRAEHADFGATVAIVGVMRVANEAC